jgi:hypothetical protein
LAPSSAESNEVTKALQAQEMLRGFQRPEMETINDGESTTETGERLIYDFRTGKLVKQSSTGLGYSEEKQTVYDPEGGAYDVTKKVFDTRIIGIDRNGNPIYNVGSAGIDLEDMIGSLEADPSLLASVTPGAGTVPPPAPIRDATNYTEEMIKRMGTMTNIVNNTNAETTNNTNNYGSTPSDSDPFRREGSITAV